MASIYYHVAGDLYEAGEPLICRNGLLEMGIETTWKWEDAPEGFDGDGISLFDNETDAREFQTTFGGKMLLRVTLPDEFVAEGCAPAWPYVQRPDSVASPRLMHNEEGYPFMLGFVPAEWLEVVETVESH